MDVERCLTEVIKLWINNGELKWKVLWEALCHSTVAHENLGREIRDWYREKTWRDPRRGDRPPRRLYIQMPGRDKRLEAVEYEFCDTGFCPPVDPEPNPLKYFRPVPVSRQSHSQQRGIYMGHLKNMKPALTNYFSKLIEPHQKRENGFRLHDVYQKQQKSLNTSFDFVQPRRKYDFRIADCCALLTKMDDVKVRQIADEITRSIHRGSNESLSMQLVGKDFHVKFFRQKRQQIYQWKSKEKEKWYLAEYDVDTFEMSKAKLENYRQEISGDNKLHPWPVEFNGGRRKEVELWSRKIFPERYSSSHPTARLYIDPEATGEVRMPLTQEKPATTWTTDELIKDLDEFVQAAYEITDFLERAPELKQ